MTIDVTRGDARWLRARHATTIGARGALARLRRNAASKGFTTTARVASCGPTSKEHVMDGKVLRQHRAAWFLTAALLGALVAWAGAPSVANAACNRGDFCLWEHANRGGGSYNWSGPDVNLRNDFFAPGVRVNDNATTAYNNGVASSSGLDDVLAFRDVGFKGPVLCVPLQTRYANLKSLGLSADHDVGDATRPGEPDGTWNDDISSYHWTTFCLP